MKKIILLVLIPFCLLGEIVTTYDSRFGIPPITSSRLAVDVGVTDQIKNPDYNPLYRSFSVPSLIDSEKRLGVAITGTVDQAELDLKMLIARSAVVTPRQFKLALLDINITPEDVEQIISGITDEKLRVAAQIEWRDAVEIRRMHPLISQISPMLGGNDQILDELFLRAMEK